MVNESIKFGTDVFVKSKESKTKGQRWPMGL